MDVAVKDNKAGKASDKSAAAPAGSADSKGKKAGVDSAAKAEAEREFRQNIDKLIDEFNKRAVKLSGG